MTYDPHAVTSGPRIENGAVPVPFQPMGSTLLALFDTVCVSTAPAVEKLLYENPDLVHTKAWHGQSVLHKLCMRGDAGVIGVLLQHGADPNARTDSGETPLHYACRQGRLPAVVSLIRGGAKVDDVDDGGHSCMHFAAQGGATTIMAFLKEVHGLDYSCLSHAKQSALHVAAIHGHWPTATFLLRRERCPVALSDIMGNTALHLAASHGQLAICWHIVLSRNGASCLVAVNVENKTPLDMSKTSASRRHKETQDWLAVLTKQQERKRKISSPTTKQYFNFLFPTVACCTVPLVSAWLAPGVQPLLYVAVIIVLVWWIMRQQHRLDHPSRLPNPARAGVFALGLVGNLMCYFCILTPYHYLDWVTNWASWTALFAYVTSMIAFFVKDPGVYRYEATVAENGGHDWTPVLSGVMGANFCDECELIQTEGVRHCRMCGVCYRNLQHHCLFMLRCITASNAPQFLYVLLSVICGCGLYIFNVVLYAMQENIGRPSETVWRILVDDTLVLVMAGLDFLGIIWCSVLALYQLQHPNEWPGGAGHGHSHSKSGIVTGV